MKEAIKEAIRLLTIASENLDIMGILLEVTLDERNIYLFNQTRKILAEVIEDLGRLLKNDRYDV